MEKIERETCKEKEREKHAVETERVRCIIFFGFRNKCGIY